MFILQSAKWSNTIYKFTPINVLKYVKLIMFIWKPTYKFL